VADNAVNAIGDQLMSGLDRHQSAEATTEDKDWRNPQDATTDIEGETEPANDLPVKNPPSLSLSVSWQETAQETNRQEREEDPTIGTVFTLAGT